MSGRPSLHLALRKPSQPDRTHDAWQSARSIATLEPPLTRSGGELIPRNVSDQAAEFLPYLVQKPAQSILRATVT